MHLLFVVEAGFGAGLGHLLRSRALMIELVRRGHAVDLWLHGESSSLAGREWPVRRLFRSPDGGPTVDKALDTIDGELRDGCYDWLVIDGYGFAGAAMCQRLASHGARLFMIDDLANRELVADAVLNQNTSNATIYQGGKVTASRFLLGPGYALIDTAYALARGAPRPGNALRRVLVTFGGVDRHGRTRRVVELLAHWTGPLEIVVVAGPYFPYRDELECCGGTHSVRVLDSLPDLAAWMLWADLMVSAAGSTVWQGCCLRVPMLVLQTVDNQHFLAQTLREAGAALCMDAWRNPGEGAGISAAEFNELFGRASSPQVRADLAEKSGALVDGKGAGRVAEVIESWR